MKYWNALTALDVIPAQVGTVVGKRGTSRRGGVEEIDRQVFADMLIPDGVGVNVEGAAGFIHDRVAGGHGGHLYIRRH